MQGMLYRHLRIISVMNLHSTVFPLSILVAVQIMLCFPQGSSLPESMLQLIKSDSSFPDGSKNTGVCQCTGVSLPVAGTTMSSGQNSISGNKLPVSQIVMICKIVNLFKSIKS